MITSIAFVSLVLVLFILDSSSFAYIDPGTGSLFVQMTLATAMGALFVARKKVRRGLSRLKSKMLGEVDGTDGAKPVTKDYTDPRCDK